MKTIGKASLILALLTGSAANGIAQDIYDDIYYNPRDEKKTPEVKKPVSRQTVAEYPAADTYNFDSGSTRDIDDYNRRGIFAVDTTAVVQTAETPADFECTRQIERFYNPDVIVASSDPTLARVYYAEPANINIIVDPGWGWSSPYYSGYWGWSNPYYYPGYWGWGGPWYSSWYYGSPYWAWSWSWGWGPGFGYVPSWAWRPGWGGPAWGWSRPNNPRHPNAWQANRPGYGRPGGVPNANGQRPGATGRPGATTRPGGHQTTTRPGGTINSGQRPGATHGGQRPGAVTTERPGRLSGGFNTMPQTTINKTHQTINRRDAGTLNYGKTVNTNRTVNTTQQRPSYQQQQTSRPNYSSPSMGGGNRGGFGGGHGGGGGRSRGGGGRH